MSAVARKLDVSYTVLFGIMNRYVKRRLDVMDLSNLRRIYLDETSSKRGHRYISVIADADTGKIVFMTEGRGGDSLSQFRDWLISRNGDPRNIETISCDFSRAFLGGIERDFPDASIVYDRFHLNKMANDAPDKVRSSNQVNGKRFKFIRFTLLKNGKNLSEVEKEKIFNVKNDNRTVGLAYEMKEALIQLYDYPDRDSAEQHLKGWIKWAAASGHQRMKSLANTVERHAEKILNWFAVRISNSFIEGLNGMIQCTKRIGRGFPNTANFITAIWFKHGRLNI